MQSWTLLLQSLDLSQQDLFMTDADPMGGKVHVVEADLTNQRLLAFVFTPGANNFHNRLDEQT